MCFLRRKKQPEIETKFKIGDSVRFRYKDELYFGWIYAIYPKLDEQNIYDIQVGGQCPMIIKGVKEEILTLRKDKK